MTGTRAVDDVGLELVLYLDDRSRAATPAVWATRTRDGWHPLGLHAGPGWPTCVGARPCAPRGAGRLRRVATRRRRSGAIASGRPSGMRAAQLMPSRSVNPRS